MAQTLLKIAQYAAAKEGARAAFDDMLGVVIFDRDLTSPPSTPGEGARYIVAAGATGAWSGHDGDVATSYDSGTTWTFFAPPTGMTAWISDEAVYRMWNGSAWIDPTLSSRVVSKSITIANPTSGLNVTMFEADKGYTITKLSAVLIGSSSPSITWTVKKGSNRTSGTEVVTSGTTTTTTTTRQDTTSFNSATIASGDQVWLESTAMSGTVTELHVTVHMVQTSS